MATAKLGEYPVFRAYDTTTKLPLDGGKLYTYENGTTTDKAVYTNEAKITEATNPVILNSNGEATFYMDGEYTFKLDTSTNGNLWTVDGINKQTTSASVAYDSNLIENPSFELDSDSDGSPDNWTKTTWGTVAFDTTDPYHGDQALKFTSIGSGGGQIISTNFIDVSVANKYMLRFSLKSSVAGIRNIVEVLWYDKDQAVVSTVSAYDDSTTNPTSWTEKIVTMTPGVAAMFAKVRITGAHNSDSTPGNVLFDHISLQEQRSLDLETTTGQTVTSAVTITGAISSSGALSITGDSTLTGDIITDGSLRLSELATPPSNVADKGFIYTQDKAAVTELLYRDSSGNTTQITAVGDSFVPAVSSSVGAHLEYIEEAVGAFSTAFDVVSAAPTTFESIGPTGSSPDNTWTALNIVPETAKFIFTKLVIELQDASGTSIREFWARKTGDGTAASDRLAICRYRHASVGARDFNVFTLPPIPIDSSRRFDLQSTVSGGPSTDVANMYLVGWGSNGN